MQPTASAHDGAAEAGDHPVHAAVRTEVRDRRVESPRILDNVWTRFLVSTFRCDLKVLAHIVALVVVASQAPALAPHCLEPRAPGASDVAVDTRAEVVSNDLVLAQLAEASVTAEPLIDASFVDRATGAQYEHTHPSQPA